MDRRKYLKTLAVGSLGATALIACEPKEKTPEVPNVLPLTVRRKNCSRTKTSKRNFL
jgi:hypothetical protein